MRVQGRLAFDRARVVGGCSSWSPETRPSNLARRDGNGGAQAHKSRPNRFLRLSTTVILLTSFLWSALPPQSLWAAEPGTQLWVARYNPKIDGYVDATAVSSDGQTLFVIGHVLSMDGVTNPDFFTIAYSALTGEELWTARYDAGASFDYPAGIAVSPDGSNVFVLGYSKRRGRTFDYISIAYDATSGGEVWRSRFDGGLNDIAESLRLAPTGRSSSSPGAAGSAARSRTS